MADSAGNSWRNARNVGNLNGSVSFRDSVDRRRDRNDFYVFNFASRRGFNLVLNGLRADADVALLDQNRRIIAQSVQLGRRNESISRTLEAGTYYVQVYSFRGRTSYNLALSGSGTSAPAPAPIPAPTPAPAPAPAPAPIPAPAPNNGIVLPANFSTPTVSRQALIYEVVLGGTVTSYTGTQNFQRAGRLALTRTIPAQTINGQNLFEVGLLASDSPGNVSGRGSIRFASNTAIFATGGAIDPVYQSADPASSLRRKFTSAFLGC